MKQIFILSCLILLSANLNSVMSQTNPPAQTLPFSTDFGMTTFTTLPTGFVAWNGVSGASVSTQAAAEGSTPTGDSGITGRTTTTTTGGFYGYSPSTDASVYIQTSSNTTNGANQLALAVNTTGCTAPSTVRLTYNVGTVLLGDAGREMGIVSQYRVGTTGAWTTITGTSNPFSFTTVANSASVSLDLPSDALNEPVVQIRWAVWRGSGSGSSAGGEIDDVSVSCLAPTAAPATISGQVRMANGIGLSKVRVMLTGGGLAEPIYTMTSGFGYYRFDDIEVGQTYVVTVLAGKSVQENINSIIDLQDNITDADFVIDENSGLQNQNEPETLKGKP